MPTVPRTAGSGSVPADRIRTRPELSRALDAVGIVLCGGASVRMGRDKASMGHPPWAHRVAASLGDAGCDTVELQGGAPGLGTSSWRQIPDAEPGAGPVPAVVQAATRHGGHRLVVAACDLPNLAPPAVARLLAAVRDGGRGGAAYRVDGHPNWSLVALDAGQVARLAVMEPAEVAGRSLHWLLSDDVTLLDPHDPMAVTDIDEPAT